MKRTILALQLLVGLIVTIPYLVWAGAAPIYFVHSDHLGTPQKLTDDTGQIVWEATYDPFGNATIDDDPDGDLNHIEFNLRFPGQHYDQYTGKNYNYYRDYDPSLGRFIQSDPIGLRGGLNTYTYVAGNPLIYTDPYGLQVTLLAGPAKIYYDNVNKVGYESIANDSSIDRFPDDPIKQNCQRHVDWMNGMINHPDGGRFTAYVAGLGHELFQQHTPVNWGDVATDLVNNTRTVLGLEPDCNEEPTFISSSICPSEY